MTCGATVIDVVNVTKAVTWWGRKVTHEIKEEPGVMNILLQLMVHEL